MELNVNNIHFSVVKRMLEMLATFVYTVYYTLYTNVAKHFKQCIVYTT